jgi:hypothetical protein
MGWTLTLMRASLRTIGEHRRLALFPAVSSVATTVLVVATVLPTVNQLRSAVSWALIAVGYFLFSLVTIFCNAALVYAANLALRGEDVTMAAGFRGAARRFGGIAWWTLISCTVSLLLRALSAVRLGGLVEVVLGLAWHLTTYLVIPLIVVEQNTVPRALRRSRDTLRRTWGANVRGSVGIALVLMLAALCGVAVLVGIGALLNLLAHNTAIAFAAVGTGVLVWLVFLSVLGGTISAVFRIVLYRFAIEGSTAPQFRDLDLSTAVD